MKIFTQSKRLVIKVGSALLVDETKGCINQDWLTSLIADISLLMAAGTQVVLVSSGAIALGKKVLGLRDKHITLDTKQAAAAVGQIQLMHLYQALLQQHKLTAAQVLLTLDDTENRRRYINLRNTFSTLLAMGAVPIINENDSVATSEIRYGDNDRLAARVAQMIEADTLVLLSDIDGLYSDDPRKNTAAEFISEVAVLTPDILAMGKQSSTQFGSGGMAAKLAAAEIAVNNGCRMLITAGRHLNPLQHYADNKVGTWFHAKETPHNAKKRWLQQHLHSVGTLVVDAGANTALLSGKSLLPIGIKKVTGQFEKGSAISIVDLDGTNVAKGLTNYSSDELHKIVGKQSHEISALLHYEGCAEAVHRDNLVLLEEK